MTIVSKPASQAYRDNYPFPDRRVAVIDKPGEPVVGMVRIESVPVKAGPAVVTDRCDFMETVFLQGESVESVLEVLRWQVWTGFSFEDARSTVKEQGGNVYAVELRIEKIE